MRIQIRVQIINAARDVVPQFRLQGESVGMGVKAAVLGVANACPDVGQQHLGHAFGALGEAVRRVFYG